MEHVKELYHNIECTRQDIANYLGICYNSVGHVLSYYGINTRENAGKKKHLQSLAPKCENVFLQETPETAYLLGYILGDGAISEVRHNLNFSSKDYQIMQAIASVLKFPIENGLILGHYLHNNYSKCIISNSIAYITTNYKNTGFT